jgi:hypothetical protein
MAYKFQKPMEEVVNDLNSLIYIYGDTNDEYGVCYHKTLFAEVLTVMKRDPILDEEVAGLRRIIWSPFRHREGIVIPWTKEPNRISEDMLYSVAGVKLETKLEELPAESSA